MTGAGEGNRQTASELSFELAGGPYAVTAARLALNDLDTQLDASLAFDVRLLVSELVTNSVQHADIGPDDSIQLKLIVGDNSVRVEVRDDGPSFDAPVKPPPDDADKGWGLFLVEQLADSWGVDDGVWFEISRRPEDEVPQSPADISKA